MSNYGKAGEVFDWVRFRNDVLKWMERENRTWNTLYLIAGLNTMSAAKQPGFIKGHQPPSLYVACSLAVVCDLSLDSYVLDKHEALMASYEHNHVGRTG